VLETPSISGKLLLSYLNELGRLVGDKSIVLIMREAGLTSEIRTMVSSRHEKTAPAGVLVSLNLAVERIFGQHALKTLVYQAAHKTFQPAYGNLEIVQKMRTWVSDHPQSSTNLNYSLQTIMRVLEATTDQKFSLDETSSHYVLSTRQCISCWTIRERKLSYCYFTIGIIRGGLNFIMGEDNRPVQETQCIATGGSVCEYVIRKFPFSQEEIGSGRTGFLRLPEAMQ